MNTDVGKQRDCWLTFASTRSKNARKFFVRTCTISGPAEIVWEVGNVLILGYANESNDAICADAEGMNLVPLAWRSILRNRQALLYTIRTVPIRWKLSNLIRTVPGLKKIRVGSFAYIVDASRQFALSLRRRNCGLCQQAKLRWVAWMLGLGLCHVPMQMRK